MLDLKRPLAFFDIESTGTNLASDRIIEICIIKINPDETQETRTWRVNPGIPISPQATAVHGITNEDLKDKPSFLHIAHDIVNFIEGCDMAGYNSNYFDVPLLNEELLRVGIDFRTEQRRFIDVFKIFQKMERRDLKAAYQFYCNKELVNAHSAEADVLATLEVFLGQIERYEDNIPNTVDALHDFCSDYEYLDAGRKLVKDENGVICFAFGKHKGIAVEEVFAKEPQYYDWIMKSNFLLDTKQKLTEIKLKAGSKFRVK